MFVWERYDPADNLILARTLRENGSLEADRTLSVLGAAAQEPDIAVNEAGDAAFAWTRWDGMRDRVRAWSISRRAFPGAPSGSRRSARPRSDAQAEIDSDGDAIFGWKRWDGSDWRIQSVRLPANGALDPVETHSADGENASDPELAIEPGGTAAIAWERWDGPILRVQVRQAPAGGARGAVSTRSANGVARRTPRSPSARAARCCSPGRPWMAATTGSSTRSARWDD